MTPLSGPVRERRRHRRISPENVRVWCVSGEFNDLYTTVNFAHSVLNLSVAGVGVETTGRLRPDVKMRVEVRFDRLGGMLRSEARIVWAETVHQGGREIHRAGMSFTGKPEITQPVREYLEGGQATLIVERRRVEYDDLKRKSEARKEIAVAKKWGLPAKLALTLLVLIIGYGSSYWGFVLAGRSGAVQSGIHYRYAQGGGLEEMLSKAYAPAYWAFREAGVDLTYDQR